MKVNQWADGRKVSLQGWVKKTPEIKETGRKVQVSFTLESENVMFRIQERRELHDTKGNVQIFLYNPNQIPQLGDHVRIWGELYQADPVSNPGEFDYGRYLAGKQISCILRGYGKQSTRVLRSGARYPLLRQIEKVRNRVSLLINRTFDSESAALFQALIVGKRKGIHYRIKDDLMKTGTSHLLAISGLHITLVAGSLYTVMILLGIGQRGAAAMTLVVIGIQVMLAGWGIPVQRSAWMAGTLFLALCFERQPHFMNTFFLAFLILLFIEPRSLTQLSFQLSFLSVFSLVVILPNALTRWKWKESLTRTLAVLIGTLPVLLFYFNLFSPISLIANILAIPLFI